MGSRLGQQKTKRWFFASNEPGMKQRDLMWHQLTVAGGSVVVVPDASGFDLLLGVAVQTRKSTRSAAVDAARVSWVEYQQEIEEKLAAWDQEDTQD